MAKTYEVSGGTLFVTETITRKYQVEKADLEKEKADKEELLSQFK